MPTTSEGREGLSDSSLAADLRRSPAIRRSYSRPNSDRTFASTVRIASAFSFRLKSVYASLTNAVMRAAALHYVGRTSSSAADVLVGVINDIPNGASRTGTSGAGQETHPTILSVSAKTTRH